MILLFPGAVWVIWTIWTILTLPGVEPQSFHSAVLIKLLEFHCQHERSKIDNNTNCVFGKKVLWNKLQWQIEKKTYKCERFEVLFSGKLRKMTYKCERFEVIFSGKLRKRTYKCERFEVIFSGKLRKRTYKCERFEVVTARVTPPEFWRHVTR
jgi:hypothetical protein